MPPKQKKQKPKSKFRKQPIPEDCEPSDDEPTTINLHEEQKLANSLPLTVLCVEESRN